MLQEMNNDLGTVTKLRQTVSVTSQHSMTSPQHSLTGTQGLTSPLHSIDVECGDGSTHHSGSPSAAAAGKDATVGAAADAVTVGDAVQSNGKDHTTSACRRHRKQLQQQQQQGEGCYSSLPFFMLMRWYWGGVLLQFLFEAWVSCSFYTLTTWFPTQLAKSCGIPIMLTQGMLIVNLMICVVTQLIAGHASDKGLPRLWSAISVYLIAGAIIAPILLFGIRPNDLATAWVLHALLLGLVGWVLGIIPAACSPIYPAVVRTTGFNLAHNM